MTFWVFFKDEMLTPAGGFRVLQVDLSYNLYESEELQPEWDEKALVKNNSNTNNKVKYLIKVLI